MSSSLKLVADVIHAKPATHINLAKLVTDNILTKLVADVILMKLVEDVIFTKVARKCKPFSQGAYFVQFANSSIITHKQRL